MAQKILVEGENDIHAITNLCMKRKLPPPKGYASRRKYETKFVEIAGSKVELLQKIPIILKESGLTNFGIVIDADTDFAKTYEQLKKAFGTSASPAFPKEIPAQGLIFQIEKIKIGLWIMPNNIDAGYLEYFLQQLIKKDDDLLPEVESAINNLISKKLNRFSKIRKQKAAMQTWLAWQKEPGLPFGLAIQKSYFDIHQPLANQFLNWMQEVFEF